jgi:pimeloyl-ACP methyl ester carboxylesterase
MAIAPARRAIAAESSAAARPALSALETQIVFPGFRSQGQAYAVVQPPPGCELVTLHASDGTKIAALFSPATPRPAGPKPALLFFYGNGMCMADSLEVFRGFRGLGFNVIMVDYEGYGMSDGTPTELGCYAAADAAYDFLLTRNEVDRKRIVAAGWSLGAGVAIDLAARRPVAGLATFSAFTNTDHMSQRIRSRLPAGFTLISRFDNQSKIGLVPCPIFMVHGTDDALVPIDMLDSLVKSAKSKVTALRLEGTGHNDLFQRGGEALFQRVKTFVDELGDEPATARP